jgi:hypothetical protein
MDRVFPPQLGLEHISEISETHILQMEEGGTPNTSNSAISAVAHKKKDEDNDDYLPVEYVYVLVGATASTLSIFFGIVLVILLVSS